MDATVDLKLAYAVIGRPQSEEPSQRYTDVEVSIDEQQRGLEKQLIITLHEPLEDLADFNQVWVTVNGQVYEGVGRFDAGRNCIIMTLYHDQPK
ncbi:hypothetical protein [Pseudomonas sp. PS02302]|uniref:hypothetical protein n=1 Tax=Pseudomonas sp. PS02302 TaxID=2991428 RepID=UPI00249BAAF1|nr:hypothetical protein [Pseudomonas sp. PS02302]